MYIPASFNVTDQDEIETFLQRYDFATLVSAAGGSLIATHLPVVVRREGSGLVVVGHVARANPHWKMLNSATEALLIFQGPHAYVSPTWYETAPAVPTWNYAVVHGYGPAQAVEDAEFLEDVIDALVERYEGHRAKPWRTDGLPIEYRRGALAAVVGIRMPLLRIEAKFKLGQNRPAADRLGTILGLEQEGHADAASLAMFMRSYLKDS
jgi:transcriptional regulator